MENTEVLLKLKESILETARACDADLVGFVPEARLEGTGAEEGAFLPGAKTLIVFGFRMTRGLMRGIEEGTTYYQYTAGGIVNLDETVMPRMLYHTAMKIEEAGWLACPEFPNNPVRHEAFEPEHYGAYLRSDAGEEKLNLKLAAEKAGLGQIGLSGQLLTPEYGPFIRLCGLVTTAPLPAEEKPVPQLCDRCGACADSCPGRAIGGKGTDLMRCAVYYRGLNRSKNPFMPENAYEDTGRMRKLLRGEGEIEAEEAEALIDTLNFYPGMRHGFAACICGRACDRACMAHLEEEGKIVSPARTKFRKHPEWKLP